MPGDHKRYDNGSDPQPKRPKLRVHVVDEDVRVEDRELGGRHVTFIRSTRRTTAGTGRDGGPVPAGCFDPDLPGLLCRLRGACGDPASSRARRSSRHRMKLPRDLGGEQLVRSLNRQWDYRRTGQVGSHVVLEIERILIENGLLPRATLS